MYAPNELPANQQLSALFEMLFGREISLRKAAPRSLEPSKEFWAAVYLDARPRIAGVLVLDRDLAIRSSAALSMFPAQQAQAFVESGMDASLRENFHEVCNVATCLFQDEFATSVRLAKVFHVPSQQPPPLFKLLKAAGHRKDIQIDIEGYGSGLATLLVA